MLMAVGYDGLGGRGGMGLWGPALFSVPLLAAWYSFSRLAAIRRTYTQTLSALSIVPEVGGLVREGHAERVADLSLAVGRELGLEPRELEFLEAAALLHHIGHVCLDDPEVLGRSVDAFEVARASADMLRQAEFLAPAAELLSPDPRPFGGAERSWTSISGQVLRVASAFDELSEGGQQRLLAGAVEALYSGPGYVYDPRVLAALERVLDRAPRVNPRVRVPA
jgi:response regulator RpfG family c-di-GMP phosphodiesterase